MDDNGESYLIFAAGTVLGIITIGMLGANTTYQFSPVLKIAMFSLLSLFLALTGIYVDKPLDYSVYILSFSSFIITVSLALSISGLDTTTHLLIAALGSNVFLGTGYALQKGLIEPDRNHFKIYAAAVLLALVLVSGYDLSGEKPRYSFISYETPEMNETNGMGLGKLTVHNRFAFPRVVDHPEYHACIYDADKSLIERPVHVEDYGTIEGETLRQLEVSTFLDEETAGKLETEEMNVVKTSECTSQNASNEIRIIPSTN